MNLSLRDSTNWFKAPSIFFCITDCSKAILLLWFYLFYVLESNFRAVLVKFGLLFCTYWEILKGNIIIKLPHMIFMKLHMLQDNCILGLKSK